LSRFDFPLPPPWLRVALVLVFLGFGVLIGNVTANPGATPSSGARELRLVLPAGGATADTHEEAPPASIPPPAPSETTPEASTLPPASTAPSQPSTPSASGTQGGGSGKTGTDGKRGGTGGKTGSKGGSGSGGGGSGGGGSADNSGLPPIKHVFLIMLADQPYAAVFGPAAKAPYLAHTLEKRGELLVRYYAVAHDELANGIALLSGQGPTAQTAVNCPTFNAITAASVGAEEQVTGSGCVYPAATQTLAGQLSAKHLTWKAYVEGMEGAGGAGGAGGASSSGRADGAGGAGGSGSAGASSAGGAATCVHPSLGAADPTVAATPASEAGGATGSTTSGAASGTTSGTTSGPASQWPLADPAAAGASYTTFRNPFVYFQSILSSPTCASDDVAIGQLAHDLASAKRTPNFSYIVPSLCDDGSNTPCAPGRAAGLPAADTFLQKVVPEIVASKAYKEGGLLMITVDQAPATGIEADSSSCCGQPRFAALPAPAPLPGGGQLPPSGGGQVGALLLSRYVKAGTISQEPFNHFSLLRTVEDLFGLKHLGYAGASGVSSFGKSLFEGAG
jgi:phosphatidylinositol-3-phosphatase